jgi:nucleoside-diphosphate-sugar epimerase
MKNILITGERGFLLRNCKFLFKDYNVQYYKSGESSEKYYNIDTIIHFASPTDTFEFKDKLKLSKSMIDLTIELIKLAQELDAKFIFASSEAAIHLENEYGINKRAMEQYIESYLSDYLILRIPRVYGVDKNKGLMKKIRLNEISEFDLKNQIIEYIDIEDFKMWFKKILTKNKIQYYNKTKRKNTIQEIKDIYCQEY